MKDIFIITSAIGNEYGIYSYQERFNQLLETIDSIETYAPNAHICIYEMSDDAIPENDLETLKQRILFIAQYYKHPYLAQFKNVGGDDTNRTAKKTVGELLAMTEFLTWLNHQTIKFGRVFKISGRFKLNSNFDKVDYTQHTGKVVIRPKQNWYGDSTYYLRLWSFDYSLLPEISKMFDSINLYNYDNNKRDGTLRVLEYSICKFLTELKIPVFEARVVGLEGCFGQDGAKVYE